MARLSFDEIFLRSTGCITQDFVWEDDFHATESKSWLTKPRQIAEILRAYGQPLEIQAKVAACLSIFPDESDWYIALQAWYEQEDGAGQALGVHTQ